VYNFIFENMITQHVTQKHMNEYGAEKCLGEALYKLSLSLRG